MNRTSHSPEDLDPLFRVYFQAQLPKAWPAAPRISETVTHQRASIRTTRGSWILAGSVAALLGFGAVLSYAPQNPTGTNDSDLLRNATANGEKLDKHIFPDHQPKLPEFEP